MSSTSPHDTEPRLHDDDTLFAFRRNVVVAASAGTGKTHRLTALYVLLALGLTSMGRGPLDGPHPPLSPEHIVATTFSRAAAREIRTRVERALVALATWDGSSALPFFEDILRRRAEQLGVTLDKSFVRPRAEQALARWPLARIDTLHGVAATIALGSAYALGLPPGARVLDEDDDRLLAEGAIDEALGAALTAGGERAEAARALVAAAGGVPNARELLTRLFERLDEEGIGPAELTGADHAAETVALYGAWRACARDLAMNGNKALAAAARALLPLLPEHPTAGSSLLPSEAVPALVALLTTRKPSKPTPADEHFLAMRDELGKNPLHERAIGLAARLQHGHRLDEVERATRALLCDIRASLGAARKRESALSFGDLLREARRALLDFPDVHRAVRGSVEALLVDEFQDSSRVQRDLVYLLRESTEGAQGRAVGAIPSAAGLAPAGLLLVGDRKQSIYGFRGADVAVFTRITLELAGRSAADALRIAAPEPLPWAPHADFVALRESRRSGPGVLSVVNAFADRDFAPPGEPRDFELRYGAVEHLVAAEPRREPGDGEVVVVRDDGQSSDALPPLVREATGAARNGFVAAAMVLREARRGAVPFRDIAVLTRRRASLPFVELGLARLGVPYVVAGRALYDTREVRDVVALLRLLLDPRDKLALATVLRGPAVGLSEQSLARLARPGRGLVVPLAREPGRDEPAEDAPRWPLERDEAARLHTFRARFEGIRPAALRASPGTAIHLVVRAFGLDEVLACLGRGAAQLGNVDRLAAIARSRGGSVAAFVRWLEARIADQTDEAEAAVFSPEDDAVRLTTIHASKGLDFPVVVLLDLDAAGAGESSGLLFRPGSAGEPPLFAMRHAVPHPLPATSGLDVSPRIPISPAALREARAETAARGIAERSRLTYVGMTRARRTLILIQGAKIPKANNAARTLQGLLDDPLTLPLFARIDDAGRALVEGEALASQPVRGASPAPELRDVRAEPKTITIATTPLSLFEGCARRYRFRQLLGLDEPIGSGQLDLFAEETPSDERTEGEADPRIVGRAAHRVLERWPTERWGEPASLSELVASLVGEGLDDDEATARLAADLARVLSSGYARRVRDEGARLVREEPFVLELGDGDGVTLALRGAIDLCVSRRDGSLDVLDYKLTRPRADLSAYTFQLRAYALAMARRAPGRPIRAGVLFLRGAGEPTALPGASPSGHLTPAEHDAFARHLAELARRYADARRDERWDGVPVARCRSLGCGFLRACHGELGGRAARNPAAHIG